MQINNTTEKFNNKEAVTAYIVLALCSIVFISLCFNNNVWLDEAFTATLVNTSMAEVLKRSMADTLPPLYNIILKITTSVFGYNIPVMKLTSVVPMILTMLLGATTVRKRFGLKTAILFMIFIAGMPQMLYYGIEIRMYSLGFFFATASGIYAYELICDFNKKNCILFSVLSVLAGYSHHFAFVAVGFVFLFLLLYYLILNRQNIRRWFICLAITMVLYIPCMIVTLKQLKSVSGYFSMPDVTLKLFLQYAVYPYMTGRTPFSILLLLLVIMLLVSCTHAVITKPAFRFTGIFSICCFLVYYGVLLFGTAISKVMTANIFVDRYLFFSLGLIWLAMAIILGQCETIISFKRFPYLAYVIIGAAFVTTYFIQFGAEYGNSANEEIEFISENFKEGDILYTVEFQEELQFCIPFYSTISGVGSINYYSTARLNEAIDAYNMDGSKNFWIVVQDGYDLTEEETHAFWDAGMEPVFAESFDFDRYKCDVYRVTKTAR